MINPDIEPLDVHLCLLPPVLAGLQLDPETESYDFHHDRHCDQIFKQNIRLEDSGMWIIKGVVNIKTLSF